jgi:hypothetical protein
VYNIDPHNRSAFDEIAVERESLEDHELLAMALFNFDTLLKGGCQQVEGRESETATNDSHFNGSPLGHPPAAVTPPPPPSSSFSSSSWSSPRSARGLTLVEDPSLPPPVLLHLPLCVRGYFNKHGNRWQRVGGIAEVWGNSLLMFLVKELSEDDSITI